MNLINDAPAHFPTLAAAYLAQDTGQTLNPVHSFGPLGKKRAWAITAPPTGFRVVVIEKGGPMIAKPYDEAFDTLSLARSVVTALRDMHDSGRLDHYLSSR